MAFTANGTKIQQYSPEEIAAWDRGRTEGREELAQYKNALGKKVAVFALGLLIAVASAVGTYLAFTAGGSHIPGYVVPSMVGLAVGLGIMLIGIYMDTD